MRRTALVPLACTLHFATVPRALGAGPPCHVQPCTSRASGGHAQRWLARAPQAATLASLALASLASLPSQQLDPLRISPPFTGCESSTVVGAAPGRAKLRSRAPPDATDVIPPWAEPAAAGCHDRGIAAMACGCSIGGDPP
jgi:hypothetical protein